MATGLIYGSGCFLRHAETMYPELDQRIAHRTESPSLYGYGARSMLMQDEAARMERLGLASLQQLPTALQRSARTSWPVCRARFGAAGPDPVADAPPQAAHKPSDAHQQSPTTTNDQANQQVPARDGGTLTC